MGCAIARRSGPTGEIQETPTPADARISLNLTGSVLDQTLPMSAKPNLRRYRSLPAPGNGVRISAFRVTLRGPPTMEPVTSRGPRVPGSKPRTEPRPPE